MALRPTLTPTLSLEGRGGLLDLLASAGENERSILSAFSALSAVEPSDLVGRCYPPGVGDGSGVPGVGEGVGVAGLAKPRMSVMTEMLIRSNSCEPGFWA